MPQSLARVLIHLVFSTKDREPLIPDATRNLLHAYMGGVLANSSCPALIVGGTSDHVHVLLSMSRTTTIADIVEAVKTTSSRWMKTQGVPGFAWQTGYGAFSVSESQVGKVVRYITRQPAHHAAGDHREEYRGLLKSHAINFDERYVWD